MVLNSNESYSLYPNICVVWDELNRISTQLFNEGLILETDNEEIKAKIIADLLKILLKPPNILEESMNDFVIDIMDLFGDHGTLLTSIVLENIENLRQETTKVFDNSKIDLKCLKNDDISKEEYTYLAEMLFSSPKIKTQSSHEDECISDATCKAVNTEQNNTHSLRNTHCGFENKVILPVESPKVITTRTEILERVFIPSISIPESVSKELELQLISTGIVNKNLGTAFKGMERFNFVQSKVFNSIYLSNRNVLVAAPTGSGKTNIALLAILKSISDFCGISPLSSCESPVDYNTPDPTKFKVAFIAPMKSLVSEITWKYSMALKELGIKVVEVTSDSAVSTEVIDRSHIIVTVPEKFDIMTRACSYDYLGQDNLLESLHCVILDEIHMLGDERGPSVEAIVSRILFNVEATQRTIRLIGLSATLPNWEDFATFLNVNKNDAFFFSEALRPTPLEKTIIGVNEKRIENERRRLLQKKNDNKANNKVNVLNKEKYREEKQRNKSDIVQSDDTYSVSDLYNSEAFKIVSGCIQRNEQVLVFVHSRNETLSTALYFKRMLDTQRANLGTEPPLSNTNSSIQIRQKFKDMTIEECQRSDDKNNEAKGINKDGVDMKYHLKMLRDCGNPYIKDLFGYGLGIHHAGLVSSQRKLSETLFSHGLIKVLVTTATLAWGVNLPARHVIIKGTNVYDSKKGSFKDLGILDILQIFGRAGRPQFESLGSAYMITSIEKVQSYLKKLTFQAPIESQLSDESNICNLLNSEIARASILNVRDAARWLKYTFLLTRIKKSPLIYGIKAEELCEDQDLTRFCYNHISKCIDLLYQSKLVRYNQMNEEVSSTNYGRLTSKYYIDFNTSNIFRKQILEDEQSSGRLYLSDFDILEMVGEAKEFSTMTSREEEIEELENLARNRLVAGIVKKNVDVSKVSTKVALLLIAYLLRINIVTPTLIMDSLYISQNGTRILRFIFELIQLSTFGVSERAQRILEWSKMLEMRIYYTQSVLRHFVYFTSLNKPHNPNEIFSSSGNLKNHRFKGPLKIETIKKIEDYATWEVTKELNVSELRCIVHSDADKVFEFIKYVPSIHFKEAFVSPITLKIMKICIKINPNWKWNHRWHGVREKFHLWVTNPNDGMILHKSQVQITQKNINSTISITDLIPIPDEDAPLYLSIRIISDKWVNLECETEINLRMAIENFVQFSQMQNDYLKATPNNSFINLSSVADTTELLNITPIPICSLRDPKIIKYYNEKKIHFLNPIQSQLFHVLFHSDVNVFLGAPTGSGKTMVAEIAMFRVLLVDLEKQIGAMNPNFDPEKAPKIVYIAPLKSLAKERFDDWKLLFYRTLGAEVVLITGSSHTSLMELKRASIIISTPEKWESITRRWWSKSRSFVRNVELLILDEIHLIGQDPRGSVVESIICKTKFISSINEKSGVGRKIRTLSLSTPLSNAKEISAWLGVDASGYYNFPPAIRPVPCTVYISGFQEKSYCPRMAKMNRPIYNKIITHSSKKPVIIFVASRRQTRITAMSLSQMCYCDGQPNRFIISEKNNSPELDLSRLIHLVKDKSLKRTLESGIGIHHAGLSESDRNIVENLFLNGIIQIVVATSTLAWGVNFPAHFAIIKGTEFFDARLGQYIDYPITDVLQMIGRAGRPQYDSHSIACIMTLEQKKSFYKRFLYDSLPLESCFGSSSLIEIINAEIASFSIKSVPDIICFLFNSFFFKRIIINPAYYDPNVFQAEMVQTDGLSSSSLDLPRVRVIVYILEKLISDVVTTLTELECIKISFDGENYNAEIFSKFYKVLQSHSDDQSKNELDSNTGVLKQRYIHFERQNCTWSELFPNIYKLIGNLTTNNDPPMSLSPTLIGQISSFFYLKCGTVSKLNKFLHYKVSRNYIISWVEILSLISQAQEFEIHPVRHNEDHICSEMLKYLPFGKLPFEPLTSPHQKVFILLQAYIFSIPVTVVDFINDINLILDQAPRILHAFIQLNILGNYLSSSAFKSILILLECIQQKCHPFVSPLYQIPQTRKNGIAEIIESKFNARSLFEVAYKVVSSKEIDLKKELSDSTLYEQILGYIRKVPLFKLRSRIIHNETTHPNILVEISIDDSRREFPVDWFNHSWIYIENKKTHKLLFVERLNKSKFILMEDRKHTIYYNFNFELHDKPSIIQDYKVSISSEKYLGIQVSCLFE
ncbi:hypothetical protein OIY81_1382 [Cryptosporidium canis]|nr:hypothetical protein OIY81_1382 [Cryptosporidium canis]